MERISSRQNALVKQFREAAHAAAEWMLLDGEHLLSEALACGVTLEVIAVAERHAAGSLGALATQAQHTGARTVVVTDPVLAAMSPVQQPSGIIALARRTATTLAQVLETAPPLVLLLSEIQDPGNVGAIIRAAEACGATGVVTGPGSADPWGWKALRGSMGSSFRMPVAARQPLADAMSTARASGVRVFATVPRGGTMLHEADFRDGSAILLGREGGGLASDLVEAADYRLTIPMRPPVESLNVAIAAALILYEAARQRGTTPS